MKDNIKLVSNRLFTEYSDSWLENKELPIEETKIYSKFKDKYIGIDNSTGNCWVEEFENELDVKKWLLGIEKENLQSHNREER